MSRGLRFEFPKIPESVNKLYFVSRGRKVLSEKGREFKNEFITKGGGVSKAKLLAFQADEESLYQLHIFYYLPYEDLYNVRYGQDKRVKSPFRDMDVSNLVKLPEDCISKLVGIRDRNNWTVCLHKREAHDGKARLVAVLKPLDIENDSFSPEGLLDG